MNERTHSVLHIRASWALHTLTASGVIIGMLDLHAIIDGHHRAAILWLIGAIVVDGIDGPIARKLDISNAIPTLDGHVLDLVVDYFTCAIVPVAFLDRFRLLPDDYIAPVGFIILLVSALWMARTDQETDDGWFRGFPGQWNMIIPTLFLINTYPWINLVVCAVFCLFTIARVQFPHPLSVRGQRPISVSCLVAWLGSMLWLAIAWPHQITAIRIVLIVSPGWTLWQVLARHRAGRADGRVAA